MAALRTVINSQDVITAPGISVAMPANAAAISGLGSPPAMARAVSSICCSSTATGSCPSDSSTAIPTA